MPETIDALITKGTYLGQVGRLSEARIILEGAIALAEEHDLGRSVARGQDNLGLCPVSVSTMQRASPWAKRPIEPRSVSAIGPYCCSQVGQMALAYVDHRGVREGGGSPRQSAHQGPAPGCRGSTPQARVGDGGLARRPGRGRSARGGGRRADRPGRRSAAENPHSRSSALEAAIARGEHRTRRSLSPASSSRSRPGPKPPTPSVTPCSSPHCWAMRHDSPR